MSDERSSAFFEAFDGHPHPLLCHVTAVESLVDILASEHLLPTAMRTDDFMHGWGRNRDAGSDLVCLSFMPSWGMVKTHFSGREVAALGIDKRALRELGEIRPCPLNSAQAEARPFVTGDADPLEALKVCLRDPMRPGGEILLAGAVPISAIRRIVLCDAVAQLRWEPIIRGHLERTGVTGTEVRVSTAGYWPRLPPDHSVQEPRPAVRLGVDRRAVPIQMACPRELEPIDVHDLELLDEMEIEEAELWEEDDDSEGDLWDRLFGPSGLHERFKRGS